MTNEEKDLLIAYLVDAGDIDPECDVEAQFLEWYQVREQVVLGEVHYKALLQAARMRARSLEEGRRADLAEGAAKWGWYQLETSPGLHRFMDHARGVETCPPVLRSGAPVVPTRRTPYGVSRAATSCTRGAAEWCPTAMVIIRCKWCSSCGVPDEVGQVHDFRY